MTRPTVLERRQYLRLPQAATFLGIHQDTLRKYIRAGKLPPVTKNEKGVRLFPQEWLDTARRLLDGTSKDSPAKA